MSTADGFDLFGVVPAHQVPRERVRRMKAVSVQNEFGFRERGELVSAVFACHRCSMRTGPMLVKHSVATRGLPCPPCNGLPTPPEYKPAPPPAANQNREDQGNA